jgi:peroxiredoxin
MMAEGKWRQPGDAAPSFRLPAINRDGVISLDDYRGRCPVLVGLFRGLHCPFCRRQIVQLGTTQEKLKTMGVETVVVVNTPVDRARLYFSYRPARVLLAADPDATTHQAFGVPALDFVEDESAARLPFRLTMGQFRSVLINPTGEMPSPRNGFEANTVLNEKDGFQPNEVDQQIVAAHGAQLAGHFLIDRQGIVRWVEVEAAAGTAHIGRWPAEEDILSAARALPG